MRVISREERQQLPEEPRVGRITFVSVLVWIAVIGLAMLNQYLAL